MDFFGKAKDAFQKAYLDGIKRKLILIGLCAMGIFLVLILFIAILMTLLGLDEDENGTDGSYTTIGTDYVVNTAISEEDIIVTDEEVLKSAINSLEYSDVAKSNLINNLSSFLGIQNEYNVNAVFAMAVTLTESTAGTNWALIDSSTYNWYSIKSGSSWSGDTYIDIEGTYWRSYSNFGESVYDFGNLISTSSYYFGGENYTVSSIAVSYCNEEWGQRTITYMTEIFEACGIDTSGYIDISGSEILTAAANIFKTVSTNKYTYGASRIPCSSGVIDCSSFVDWVMYDLGYNEFGGQQRDTYWWYYTLTPESYGWTSFVIGDNDISVLQPGDIIVLNGFSYNKITGKTEYRHHMQIFVSAQNDSHAYVYDCGGQDNWSVSTPTLGDSTFWGYRDAKVIRITSNNTDE